MDSSLTMAEVKVAVVGTGGIARRHGLALAENTDAVIVAAVDSDRGRREEFIEAITTGRQPLVSVSDGYQALRVCHAILESARTGETVDLT